MTKKFKGLGLLIPIALLLTLILPATADAANYSSWSDRGVKPISYTKNLAWWSTNNTKITSFDYDQTKMGFLVSNRGATKVNSLTNDIRFTYNYKNQFLAGAKVGGLTLGYSMVIIDQGRFYRTGDRYWYFDI